MTTKHILEELLDGNLETIQPSTFLGPLSDEQKEKFSKVIANLVVQANDTPSRKANLVFRGDNRKNLAEKLSSRGSHIDDDKIHSLLFFYGDKAKYFYKYEDVEAKKLRWLNNIEDTDEATISAIFGSIQKLLTKPSLEKFRRAHKKFADFFQKDNLTQFTSKLVGDDIARDYYLYFLHTVGPSGLGDNSVLVSTSLSYDEAYGFSGRTHDGRIIYYVVPEPIERFAVTHLRMQKYELSLISRNLPTYKYTALHPSEQEIAIRGALFSCFILGVKDLLRNSFVANPHLFTESNRIDSILRGLEIDYTDFESGLIDTGYAKGVGTRLDGRFRTILRKRKSADIA